MEDGINFEEYDIHDNKEYFQEFEELGGRGTPFTIKKENGVIVAKIVGYKKDQLLKELR